MKKLILLLSIMLWIFNCNPFAGSTDDGNNLSRMVGWLNMNTKKQAEPKLKIVGNLKDSSSNRLPNTVLSITSSGISTNLNIRQSTNKTLRFVDYSLQPNKLKGTLLQNFDDDTSVYRYMLFWKESSQDKHTKFDSFLKTGSRLEYYLNDVEKPEKADEILVMKYDAAGLIIQGISTPIIDAVDGALTDENGNFTLYCEHSKSYSIQVLDKLNDYGNFTVDLSSTRSASDLSKIEEEAKNNGTNSFVQKYIKVGSGVSLEIQDVVYNGTIVPSYTLGGTVTGLNAGTLVLQNNGGDNLTISANGSFVFNTSVKKDTAYNVTVLQQPVSHTCTVSNGTGIAKSNVNNVNVTCVYDINAVAVPTFSPSAGTYPTTQTVTISTTTSGAEIRYTTNGSDPTCSTGTIYSSAVSVSVTTTLKAIGCKSGMIASSIVSGAWTIDQTVPSITINPISIPYISSNTGAINSQQVAWSSNRNGSYSIRLGGVDCTTGVVQTNGTATAGSSNTVTVNAISLAVGTNTLRVCVVDSISSQTGSNTFTLTRDDTLPTVTATPDAYSSATAINVTLACNDASSGCDKIAYTSNGTNPTMDGTGTITNGTQYSSPITPPNNATTTYKYIARDNAGNVSTVSSSIYTVDSTLPTITINSVTPPAPMYINGTTNPQINWQSDQTGTYNVKIGGASCSDATQATGAGNVSGSVTANSPIASTINNSDLSEGANSIRICVTVSGKVGMTTQTITKDITAPVAGSSGTITTANVTSSGLTLNWTKATDSVTAQGSLQYKVVQSLSNNISTVTDAETTGSGRSTVQNWATDIATVNVTGLSAGTTYYFNVLVKDGVGNTVAYTTMSQMTLYTISGTVSGLTSSGLVLQNNGGDNLNVTSGATNFTFSTGLTNGSSYSVTVATQPSGLGCTVSSGGGTVSGSNIANISVACNSWTPNPPVTYSWGTFTDNFNGTVKFVGIAGTFGGNTYTAQTLTFMKCSQGQQWKSATNDCTGTGSSGDDYGAGTYLYCNENDNDCNGGTNTGTLGTFSGNGSSTAYTSCNTLSFAGKGAGSWRVPTKNELKTLIHCTDKTMPVDNSNCGGGNSISPAVNNLFPNTVVNYYWSSTAYTLTSDALCVNFSSGLQGDKLKVSDYYIRCVSGP